MTFRWRIFFKLAKNGKTSWGSTPRRPMPVSTFRCTLAFLP